MQMDSRPENSSSGSGRKVTGEGNDMAWRLVTRSDLRRDFIQSKTGCERSVHGVLRITCHEAKLARKLLHSGFVFLLVQCFNCVELKPKVVAQTPRRVIQDGALTELLGRVDKDDAAESLPGWRSDRWSASFRPDE